MRYIELGVACDDCAIAICNDDYSGMSQHQMDDTKAGIKKHGKHLLIGDELGIMRVTCDICGIGLYGNRHKVGYFE